MRSIRINNDIIFQWTITADEVLTMDNCKVRITYQREIITPDELTISNNVVKGIFRGMEQRHIGIYYISCIFDNGDRCNAVDIPLVKLVSHTYEEKGENCPHLKVRKLNEE